MFLLAAVAGGGCSSPVGVLEPVRNGAPDATRLHILVATTRAASPETGVIFSGERGEGDLADVVVSIPPDENRQIGQVQWPRTLPPDPANEFATLGVDRLSQKQMDAWLKRHGTRNRRVLVYVHGFNTRFETALFSFAQIFHDSGAEAAPILFSWPSRGNVFSYVYDRESATFSRDALEALLRRLANNADVQEILILAHSMGAWLTVESLRQMAIRDAGAPRKVRSVILAAPDLDVDVFRSQLRSLGEHRPDFVVFVSREDRALQLSRGFGGNIERLGIVDPGQKPWIAEKGVEVIDLSGSAANDPLRHSKFARDPDVVRFLGEELINDARRASERSFGERIETLTRGVADNVTTAAEMAISAPTALLDQQTKRASPYQPLAPTGGDRLASPMDR